MQIEKKKVISRPRKFNSIIDKESNYNSLMAFIERQKEFLDKQEYLIDKQEYLIEKQENMISLSKESTTEIIDYLNNTESIRKLSIKDYGRLMGTLADGYVKEFLTKELRLSFIDDSDNKRDGNESGYDGIITNGPRVQIKFRQVGGNTLYSRQTYIETTRRLSAKNSGVAGQTGHVAYSSSEFDGIFVILAPTSPKLRDRNNWKYSYIFVNEILDPKNPNYVDTKISSSVLKMGADWRKRLNAQIK